MTVAEATKDPHGIPVHEGTVLISGLRPMLGIIVLGPRFDNLPLILLVFQFERVHVHIRPFAERATKQIHFLVVNHRGMVCDRLRSEIGVKGSAVELLPLWIGLILGLPSVDIPHLAAVQAPDVIHELIGDIFATRYVEFLA